MNALITVTPTAYIRFSRW